jgi:hypothetical protein
MTWHCDISKNPVGTDTVMIGAPPCDCQGCRAAARIEALEAALREIASDPDYGGHRAQVYKLIAQHALAPEQDK